jgi:multicomponent Na+:H+ antiporter subunit E
MTARARGRPSLEKRENRRLPGGQRRRITGERRPVLIPGIVLVLIWLALWGTLEPGMVLLGVLVVTVIVRLFPLPPTKFEFELHPWRLVVLVLRFGADVVVASLQVAWLAVRPAPPRGGISLVQLTTDSDLIQTLTALAVSLVPGSLIVEADPDRRTLTIHVLDYGRRPPEMFVAQVLAQEARLRAAVGNRRSGAQSRAPLPNRSWGALR